MTTHDLEDFEGRTVASAGIKFAGAATGLSDAMRIAPAEYHQGETVHLVLECTVGKVEHERHDARDDDDDRLRRVHKLKVATATFVPAELVANVLQQHRDALAQLAGQQQLDAQDGE